MMTTAATEHQRQPSQLGQQPTDPFPQLPPSKPPDSSYNPLHPVPNTHSPPSGCVCEKRLLQGSQGPLSELSSVTSPGSSILKQASSIQRPINHAQPVCPVAVLTGKSRFPGHASGSCPFTIPRAPTLFPGFSELGSMCWASPSASADPHTARLGCNGIGHMPVLRPQSPSICELYHILILMAC